jgi:tripartite-type tricarboxylate transporter receptor subunit TctC
MTYEILEEPHMQSSGRRSFVIQAMAMANSFGLIRSARAQGQMLSAKPVTIVVPYAAGGPTDVTARRLAEAMGPLLQTPVVVENKPGAATNIAAAYVARAPKDGHTLLLAPGTMTSVNPYIYRSLNYRPDDFAPISLVSRQAFVLSASQAVPARSLTEFVTYARSRPSGLSFGHVGAGSVTHIVGEWIGRELGIHLVGVPYKGSSQSTVDLVGGRLDTQVEGISSAVPMHLNRKTHILVSMGQERSILPPGVQTFQEAGFPALVAYAYFGLMAPTGTPDAMVRRLHAATVQALSTPQLRDRLLAAGETPSPSATVEAYAEHLQREYERWGRIVKPMNIQLE